MEKLEYDRLWHIFGKLEAMEQITIAGTHPRFIGVIRRLIRKEAVDVDRVYQYFSSEELTKFLSECGKSIKHIIINAYSFEWLTTFAKHCSDLEKVDILSMNDEDNKVATYLGTCKNLRAARLKLCQIDGEALFKSFQNLQSLTLRSCTTDGRGLTQLTNLIELKLIFCNNIAPKYITSMLETNKKLKMLQISYCPLITNDKIGSALRKHNNIEQLTFDIKFFKASNDLSGLPNLKHISIYSEYLEEIEFPLLKQLCRNYSRTLETLELALWTFPPDIQWPIFPRLTKLAFLDSKNFCDDLLKKIGESCKFLQKADFMGSMKSITGESLLNFIKASNDLSYLEMGVFNQGDGNLFIQIGKTRSAMYAREPLTIACLNRKWEEVVASTVRSYEVQTPIHNVPFKLFFFYM